MKRLQITFILIFLVTQFNLWSQEKPTMIRDIEGVHEYQLKNGLKVLLMPDNSESNFVVNIVYNVGSRHEGYGEKGMAHLLEHMLFRSCKNFTDIKKAIAEKGAYANGTTSDDRTNYYEQMPASPENLQWAIEMEADRMINAKILKDELEKEFTVVRNEFEIGENYPSGVLYERILSSAYLWHNYGNSTIGSKEDIERVPVEFLRAFYKKYYQPDNATIIVAGKFDEAKALDLIVKNLGAIPRPTRVLNATSTVEPPQDGQRYVELKRNGDENIIAMAYHTPSFSDPDYLPNDLLIQILTAEGSGRLYKKVVDTKLATSIYGFTQPKLDPGITYYSINIPIGGSIDAAKKGFFEVMDSTGIYQFNQAELDRAKDDLKKQTDKVMSNTINFALWITEFIAAGDYRLIFMYRDNIDKATLADVQRVASKYYKGTNRTWGQFFPDKNTQNDRTIVAEHPNIQQLVANYKGTKTVENLANFDATISNIKANTIKGKIHEKIEYSILNKPTKNGKIEGRIKLMFGDETSLMNSYMTEQMLSSMFKAGTKTKSRTQIKETLDKLKSDLNFYMNGNSLNISIKTDKENLSQTLNLLEDILKNPAFSQDEYDKMMIEKKTDIETYKNDPNNVAFNEISIKLNPYPKGHPFAPLSVDDQLAQIQKVTNDDIKKFYTNFIGLNEGYLAFVGDVDSKVVIDKFFGIFKDWKSKVGYKKIEKIYKSNVGQETTIQINDKTNAACAGGMNLNISERSPDYPSLFLADELLGGGTFLNSRIPTRLREKEGLSYGAGSYLEVDQKVDVGTWGVYAFFNPLKKDSLIRSLKDVIKTTSQGTFVDSELVNCKKSLIETRKINLGTNRFLTYMFINYMEDKINLEYYDEMSNKFQKATLSEVNNAAKKYLDLNKFIFIYTGDFKKKN